MKVSPIGAGAADEGTGDQLSYAGPPSPVDPSTGQTATWLIQLLNDLRNACITLWNSGPTAKRPTDPYIGQLFYDTTVGATIICTAQRVAGSPSTPAIWDPIDPVSSLSYTVTTPLNTGFSVTIPNDDNIYYLHLASTPLATGTVTMPPTPFDGQTIQLGADGTVTALTISPNAGQSMVGTLPATINAGIGYAWFFSTADSKWRRLQ